MHINSIEIRGFRAVGHAKIKFDKNLAVLIGDNATSKTAILDAISAALAPLLEFGSTRSRYTKMLSERDFHISENGNIFGEFEQEKEIYLNIDTSIGDWDCVYTLEYTRPDRANVRWRGDRSVRSKLSSLLENDFETAPIVASYGADRATKSSESEPFLISSSFMHIERASAYWHALESRSVYNESVRWFETLENLELRRNRDSSIIVTNARLDTVRTAVSRMLPGFSNLRMVGLPARLIMEVDLPNRSKETLSMDQLSGGYRVMLGLVMDLARRMADLNPHLHDPLTASGVVLIDEVDLHLHPRWQQIVVYSLRDVFPNIQFILSTHSPLVLTTVEKKHIINLSWRHNRLCLVDVPSTYGAESGRIMGEIMGVDERPPEHISKFVKVLNKYRSLVRDGLWNSLEAEVLFKDLQKISPDDPIISALSLERRRLKLNEKRK